MVELATRLHWSGLWNMFDHGNIKDHETWFILVLRSWSNHGWPWYKVGHIPRGLWIMFYHGIFLWPWTKVNHGPQGPWLTMVPKVAIYRDMKHGRTWIIHGHFVVNHVFKTWSTLFKTWSTMFWPRSFHRGSRQTWCKLNRKTFINVYFFLKLT